jgi:hypothetical protein
VTPSPARIASAFRIVLAAVVPWLAAHPAHAGVPFIESLDVAWAYPGTPIVVNGGGFGATQGLSAIAIDDIPQPVVVTYWSDERVIFRLPYLPEQELVGVRVLKDLVLPSNPMPLALEFPSLAWFTSPPPGGVLTTLPVRFQVAPESPHGTVTSVAFDYRVPPDPIWHPFATDTDGSGPTQGTSTWIGTGDGWSALFPGPLGEGPVEFRATATDVFGQVMTGIALYVHDPTPLAPRLLDGPPLAATVFDADLLEGDAELTDEQVEELLLILFPVSWHHKRTLTHVDQDTMDIKDAAGNDLSGNACGPVSAAVCLKWFGDRFPSLARSVDSLAREIAKDAKATADKGTNDDDLAAAIKAALKRAGLDPEQWKVTRQNDPKLIWRSVIEGLNRDGYDKILTINQQAATDMDGDGDVDSLDVIGHFVTVSSRGTRYRDYSGDGPPPYHIMGYEEYVDFMDSATGETEEYRVDTSKKPPTIVGYDLPGGHAGTPEDPKDPTIESVICVKPPSPPPRARSTPGQYPGLVVATIPVPGPGVYHFALPAAGLPPGPALLTMVGRDGNGNEAAEFSHMMVITDFCDVGFAPSVTAGAAPLAVTFSNVSAPTDSVLSWAWDFDGDGIVDSDQPSPTHVYSVPGDFDVTLTAFTPHGEDVKVAPGLIHVGGTASVGPDAPVTLLRECQPNPFRGRTTVSFALARGGEARLEVFGVDGRRMRTLARGALAAGEHTRTWDGADDRGRALPAGLYFVRLTTGAERMWRRVALVR